jgi:tetratricopeptide (TPR) repeat protein
MKTLKNIGLVLLSVIVLFSCSNNEHNYKLGKIDFDVSGNAEAREHFRRGFLLLHSFEYVDAAEAFLEAQKADPNCIMAYWGEAMTYHHPIWQEQDYNKGQATLAKYGSTPAERIAKAETELERDFLKSIEILYGDGSKISRDKAYAEFLGELYQKYPDNHEVASFYALSLLGSVSYGRHLETYQKSAEISRRVLEKNPQHPGALHYYIHANDEPDFAQLALLEANKYSIVAPDAAHALHMPSHIYLALGMWDKVISSNEASWPASIDRKNRKSLDNNALDYHSFHWLQYGYLQTGRVEDAKNMLHEMIAYSSELPSPRARVHQIYLRTTYLAETEDWNSEFANLSTEHKGINVAAANRDYFINGMIQYHAKNDLVLSEIIETIASNIESASAQINLDEGISTCSTGGASRDNTTKLDIDRSRVMEFELRALSALLNNQQSEAVLWFEQATDLEEKIGAAYGPPFIVKPSHELYAEYLMALGKFQEAIDLYNTALELAPNRSKSILGKQQAEKSLESIGM